MVLQLCLRHLSAELNPPDPCVSAGSGEAEEAAQVRGCPQPGYELAACGRHTGILPLYLNFKA